jgi:phosphate transport system substrate-binding protein
MYDARTANANARRNIAAAIVAAVFCLSLLTGCMGRQGSMIIIAGSTSVQPYAEILAEEYAHFHADSEIDVQGGGSSAGITAAQSGTADIGMTSRALTSKEQGLWSVEIAKDGLSIIVNPRNPVADLTLAQIREVYAGRVTSWGDLGGADAKIHIIAREEGSGTRAAFEDLVMGGDWISPKAIVQDSNGAVRQLVSGDVNSIGFISLGLIDDTVKPIRLGGVEPTVANVQNGSYSLFRPFLFVMNEPPEGLVAQFIGFTMSPEGQRILAQEGLIPLTGGAAGS